MRAAPRRLVVVIVAVCLCVVGIPAAAPGASSLLGLTASSGQAPAAAPMAELAKRRDPRGPNRIGWQGCPAPICRPVVDFGAIAADRDGNGLGFRRLPIDARPCLHGSTVALLLRGVQEGT